MKKGAVIRSEDGLSKTCTKCKQMLPLDCFSKNRNHADGLQYTCRECGRKINVEWQKKNWEKMLAYHREYRKRRPLHHKAREITSKIRTPMPCFLCGSVVDLEKHHPSYDHPKHIVWLCRKCHRSGPKDIVARRIEMIDDYYQKILNTIGRGWE